MFWETIAALTLVAVGGYGLGFVSGVRYIPRKLIEAGENGLVNRLAQVMLELRERR